MSHPPTQRDRGVCDCGRTYPITPQPASAYEFDWACLCGRAGVISWAHAAPPPTIQEKAPQQERLFV